MHSSPPPSGDSGALSATRLAQHLAGAELDWEIAGRVASTSDALIARARVRAPRRASLLAADEQTAGRGRRGRAWLATPGGALLFSIALPWPRGPADSAPISLACGAAVAECLAQSAIEVRLKWPNDVLLEGAKLAGILAELAEDPRGERTLVIGMGLNLYVDEAQRRAIGQPVADLAQCVGRGPAGAQREAWLARLALALIGAARQFALHGFDASRASYLSHCAYLGESVILQATGGPVVSGTARGVDAEGRLLLESDGRILTMLSGEMSLRAHRQVGPEPLP